MLLKSAGCSHCPGFGSSFIEINEVIRSRSGVQRASTFPLDASQPISEKEVRSVKRKTQASDERVESASMEVVPTEAGYDRWAEIYDSEDNPLVLLEGKYIGPLAGDVAGLTVADIGCGTGRHALRLAAAGARVTAVDFSTAMLERACRKPGAEAITFVRHDLAKPFPLRSAAFDRIFCCLVLDHIGELDNFFLELRRLCRPNVRVIISVMHPAMSLQGVQARFIDPASGHRISPASHAHQMSDYLMAAVRAGLSLEHVSEHAADAALTAQSPRAVKYLGWPTLLLLKLAPSYV
jgi:malonyl-CoA O-methyltransferase